jgi:protein kinase A
LSLGVESRNEEDEAGVRDERDVQSAHHQQALGELSYQRTQTPLKSSAPVRKSNSTTISGLASNPRTKSDLSFSFLVNINYAFQDHTNLYLVSDLLTGGDLRFHIGKKRRFNEEQTKFMIACMLLGLEYMHNENVIHRDIKPENVVMEDNGYLRITDMGIAKILRTENSQDTSGTPGYMAPEVMCRQNHGVAVDYFAIGVIGFEFMMGRRPYVGRTRKEIRDMLFAK